MSVGAARLGESQSWLLAVFLGGLVFASSAVQSWPLGSNWHDQQRILQLFLLALFAPVGVMYGRQQALPRPVLYALLVILVLGGLSAWQATFPEWALKEWTRYAGLLSLVILLGSMARNAGLQHAFMWMLLGVGIIHAWQFLVFYLMAFVTGIHMLSPLLLFEGFDNPRFFGQFQILLMPMLAVWSVRLWMDARRRLAGVLLLVLAVQWCIAFSLSGRGLLVGLLVGHLALLVIRPQLWRITALQAAAAILGLLLWQAMFNWIPAMLGIDSVMRSDQLRTSLSGREQLWGWAWDMALSSPWLGVGPMHYSATYNPIAAHPHQVVLQWLAEWGFPATLLALMLGAWGILHGAGVLRRQEADPLDAGLWLSIVGALVLAQVDGVFVMPYTETWLAILIGLAVARWSRPAEAGRAQRVFVVALALPVVYVLGSVLLLEVPTLVEVQEAYLKAHATGWKPRFWLQGWIPME